MEAHKVRYEELTGVGLAESSAQIRARVTAAMKIQEDRYRGTNYRFNGDLGTEGVRRYCRPDAEGQKMMRTVYESMELTARSYNRILKVARTIADLEGSAQIRVSHLTEAVSYRAVDRKYWDSALGMG